MLESRETIIVRDWRDQKGLFFGVEVVSIKGSGGR